MATTLQEFLELLDTEEECLVNLDKLRKASVYGIPDKIRPLVWPNLLQLDSQKGINHSLSFIFRNKSRLV